MIDKEVKILRDRNVTLERENEKLNTYNKQLRTNYRRKIPSNIKEKPHMAKFHFVENSTNFEGKESEYAFRQTDNHQISISFKRKDDTIEIDRLK